MLFSRGETVTLKDLIVDAYMALMCGLEEGDEFQIEFLAHCASVARVFCKEHGVSLTADALALSTDTPLGPRAERELLRLRKWLKQNSR